MEKVDNENLVSDLENLQVKRKLASVQLVDEVIPSTKDENFDIVKILGWQVVCPKNEFKKGEKVVYFEIDSQLPDERWCQSLEFYDFRVGTITVAGELSQGFVAHIDLVFKNNDHLKVGDDLTEELGITKYDEEEKASEYIDSGKFPIHAVPFTDEPRVQSEPRYLDVFKGRPYVACIKYDGTSATYLLNPNDKTEFWACSRNKMLDPKKKDDYWKVADKYKIKEKLTNYPDYAIQAEVYGPGIQKNPLGVKDKSLAVFNIYSISQKRCLDYDELVETCAKLDLPTAKLFERGDSFNYSLEDLHGLVKGNYEGTENQREGLVFRLAKNWYTPQLRASFKIISNDFLVGK